ncbi:MAG: hypothetical protein RBS72_13050 [Sedimentisphaerales bacterium]|nr:hypothetical protein [Sedimentisphaerales bacterium]HNY78625.1 hypothetical protein [Sedimentisphaerales bacterium]HOC64289.1 hypothetical protein [Sedimentisphaerales bacterium]HOH64607.1 hypothetical protein [Sedimentisphaerales bacterium]HPY49362.1 hypothetical protein [Sedimentisphaerales bacterium]
MPGGSGKLRLPMAFRGFRDITIGKLALVAATLGRFTRFALWLVCAPNTSHYPDLAHRLHAEKDTDFRPKHATVKRQNARDMQKFFSPFFAWTYTNQLREKRHFFRPKRATPSKGRGPHRFAAGKET